MKSAFRFPPTPLCWASSLLAAALVPRIAAADPPQVQVTPVVDAVLDGQNRLRGAAYYADGRPAAGQPIQLSDLGGRQQVLRFGERGEFISQPLRPGAGWVRVGDLMTPLRLWRERAAPPGSRPRLLFRLQPPPGPAGPPGPSPHAAAPPIVIADYEPAIVAGLAAGALVTPFAIQAGGDDRPPGSN